MRLPATLLLASLLLAALTLAACGPPADAPDAAGAPAAEDGTKAATAPTEADAPTDAPTGDAEAGTPVASEAGAPVLPAGFDAATADSAALLDAATRLARRYLLADGHIDVPYRMTRHAEDVSQATEGGDFDHPRAKAGGLDAPFMSIYLPASLQATPGASKALADSLIDLVEGVAVRAPGKFAVATSPGDLRAQHAAGRVALPMGMENGSGLEDDLANVQHFFDRGIRYITLTHSRVNNIGDSSYDTARVHQGLSDFGVEVVREMNRLGIMVDISHVSDSTFYHTMRVTKAPAIASHSSCRHFTPGFERNMGDAMIERLAKNGGVIMINFGSSFLRNDLRAQGNRTRAQVTGYLARQGIARLSEEGVAYFQAQRRAHPAGTVGDVADHIDHVVDLVGVEHVGLGSDFDGVFALPAGLQDVDDYPNLVAELLRRGYAEDDIAKILGGNLLRVWDEVERVAAASQGA